MTRHRPRLRRALAGALSLTLAATGLSLVAATPAAAAPAVVYDSIPDPLPPAYSSLGFQATSTDEFGDLIELGGGNRLISEVTVGLTNWACENWATGANPCETSEGATFDHPITLNLYEVDRSGANPQPGALITTVTETKTIPYRPSASAECTGADANEWYDTATDRCYPGFNTTVTFDGLNELVGNEVIVGVAFNTQTWGYEPINESGPYNSLNVSLVNAAPTVGTQSDPDGMYWATTYLGASGAFEYSDGWGGFHGLALEIVADRVPAIDPLTPVTVYERDLGDYSASLTLAEYLEWHEGNPLAGADGSVVFEDGLHLGLVSASTVIKGIDASQPGSVVTRQQLRELIERASVVVESGTVTYQVPIFFGSPASPTFTTLRSTSLAAGTHGFTQADTWATTRAFGPYGVQQTASLGELIDAVFDAAAAAGGGVALAGFGVQADAPAVVSQVIWDGTRYTFTQPVIEACVPTAGATITNVNLGGWDFSQTRSQGIDEFVEGGLRVETFPDDDNLDGTTADQRKAAGYVPINIALSEVGTVGIEFASFEGARPSLQLGFDADGDGTRDAYLVGEPWAYPNGGWSPTTNGDWADAKFWVTGGNGFGVAPGGGYPGLGTLDEWLLANPEARITEFGYSLGSGVDGEAVISSITVGCETTTFDFELETLAPPSGERLAGADRYETAVAISQEAYPDGTTAAFIATGTNFADALSAAPAASTVDAPLLLTRPTALPPAVAAEITRLGVSTVYIIGGTSAVSAGVASAIAGLGVDVVRIQGADRYETSRNVADRFFDAASDVFVATGLNFPDALAAGPAAAQVGGPVILVRGSSRSVDGPTLALLSGLATDTVYIAGGTSVVTTGIEQQLDGLAAITAVRLAGADRIATAIAINDEVFGLTADAYLATSAGFADALAGGAAAASKSAPLYLSGPACVPTEVLASITLREASTVFVLGGTAVLSNTVLNLVPCSS